jgi:hypothetical protein
VSSPLPAVDERRDQATPSEGVLIFLHIPKTAGSTVLRILEHEYGHDGVLKLYDSVFGDEVAALRADELGRTRVVAGHFYFGVHSRLTGPCRYVTFLRDPLDRVVSHYEFARRWPDHYLHEPASKMNLADYVRFCGAAEPNNDQTRLLAGREMASSNGASSPAMLSVAKRNLDFHAAVGLTEAFDASLVLMRRVFGWRRPFYVSHNVGDRARQEAQLPRNAREVIEAHNALDVELYQYARERFRAQIAEQADHFDRDLRAFRRLNALYGRLHSIASVSRRRPERRRA